MKKQISSSYTLIHADTGAIQLDETLVINPQTSFDEYRSSNFSGCAQSIKKRWGFAGSVFKIWNEFDVSLQPFQYNSSRYSLYLKYREDKLAMGQVWIKDKALNYTYDDFSDEKVEAQIQHFESLVKSDLGMSFSDYPWGRIYLENSGRELPYYTLCIDYK